MYTSGVVFSSSPLPHDMSYKVYTFASDAEREAALADPRNDGLQYARKMKGENGCDVEIVYEFFPKTGGGLMVEISQTMNGLTEVPCSLLHTYMCFVLMHRHQMLGS